MKVKSTLAALILAAAVATGGATAKQPVPPPGQYNYYSDEFHTTLVGYEIYECDGTRQGPWGIKTQYLEYIPGIC